MRLTPADVAALALPPGKADHIEWDEALPGFGVRLRGKAASWVVQYRIGRQQRRESLGDVRKIRLDDARRIARQRFASAELGIDAVAERALAEAASLTLGTVVERYFAAKRDGLRRKSSRQRSAISASSGSRCTVGRSPPSSAPTWPRGCRSWSRRMGGARRRRRARICRRCLRGRCARACARPTRSSPPTIRAPA